VLAFIWISFVARQWFPAFSEFQYDDAFITYRYSANLANGNGLVFNVGDPTNSASSFLWAILLVPAYLVTGENLPVASLLLSHASFAMSAGVMYEVARRLAGRTYGQFAGVVAAILFVTSPYLLYWTQSGMETAFFILTLLLCILATVLLIEDQTTKPRLVGALCVATYGLLTLTRWEGFAIALGLGVLIAISGFVCTDGSMLGRLRSCDFRPLLLSATCALGLLIFYQVSYGSFIPDAIRFKRLSYYYIRDEREAFLGTASFVYSNFGWLLLVFGALAVLGSVANLIRLPRNRRSWQLMVAPAVLVGLFVLVLNSAHSDYFRYETVLTVPIILAFTQLPALLRSPIFIERSSFEFVRFTVLTALVVVAYVSVVMLPQRLNAMVEVTSTYDYLSESRKNLAMRVRDQLDESDVVLSGDIGVLSFYALDSRFFDSSGLTNRGLIDGLMDGLVYDELLQSAKPTHLLDTITMEQISGVSEVYDRPDRYFVGLSAVQVPECSFQEAFDLDLLDSELDASKGNLGVGFFEMEEGPCGAID